MIKATASGAREDCSNQPRFVIQELTDPLESARAQAQHERARRNDEWLAAHWHEVLPQARGKFLGVSGQEAFVADTPGQAWAMAEAAHPEDDGATVQYVQPEQGPRIYENHRALVAR